MLSENPELYRETNTSVDSLASMNGGNNEPNSRKPSNEISLNEQSTVSSSILKSFEDMSSKNYNIIDEGELRWDISSWSEFKKNEKKTSEPLACGGYNWRILVFPNGNNVTFLSIYLQLDMPIEPEDSEICADFVLGIVNPENEHFFTTQYSNHRFSKNETDWGFTQFLPLITLNSPTTPLIINDRTTLLVKMRVIQDETGVLFHTFRDYDSKKVTGFVGLKNQGATCYMNSLLQSLYCTNYFRKAVYQIPLPKENETSVTLSLQRLFYSMQTSLTAVETNELTNSFGWNTVDAFAQHDVQEFLRVLTDNLEEKMKGTPADGMIQSLFVGKMKSYIQCIDVNYESSRVEDFYDIQLNVKGMKNVLESFHDYIQVEKLEGENKYMAEGHGLQDAKKGVSFIKFPPVLHLQLKRFEYDFNQDRMIKINDRYEFPLILDLDEYLEAPEDAPLQDKGPQRYHLHGVLVHAGNVDGGHYCAFIRPTLASKWFKFDDDRVIPVTLSEVLDDNFGGEFSKVTQKLPKYSMHRRFTNAYMLVYIRESDYERILGSVSEEDVPLEIRTQFEREKRDLQEKELELREKSTMVKVRIVHDAFLMQQPMQFDVYDFQQGTQDWSHRFHKTQTHLKDVLEKVAQAWNVTSDQLRLWFFSHRANKTYRPTDEPLTEEDQELKLEELRLKYNPGSSPYELHFYAEISSSKASPFSFPLTMASDLVRPNEDQALTSTTLNNKTDSNALILIKVFDITSQRLKFAGHLYVSENVILKHVEPQLCNLVGFPPHTPLSIWEEVFGECWEEKDRELTLNALGIGTGDILTIQRLDVMNLNVSSSSFFPSPSTMDLDSTDSTTFVPSSSPLLPTPSEFICKTIPEYYDFLQNRIEVQFRPRFRDQSSQPTVTLLLLKRYTYDEVCRKLAHQLQLSDPLKLRFTPMHLHDMPKSHPIKRHPELTLKEMISLSTTLPSTMETTTPSFSHPQTNHHHHHPSHRNHVQPHSSPNSMKPMNVSRMSGEDASVFSHLQDLPIATATLFYEVLDIPITEIDSKRKFMITLLISGKEESIEVFVDKQSTMLQLAQSIQEKLKFPCVPYFPSTLDAFVSTPFPTSPVATLTLPYSKLASTFILYEVTAHRVTRIFTGEEPIHSIPDYPTMVVQVLPTLDLSKKSSPVTTTASATTTTTASSIAPSDLTPFSETTLSKMEKVDLLPFLHFDRSPTLFHGIPFRYPVLPFWTGMDLKKYLQKYLGYSEKEMNKVQLCLVPLGAMEESQLIVLEETKLILEQLQVHSDCYLGLNHPPRRNMSHSGPVEKGIRIFN